MTAGLPAAVPAGQRARLVRREPPRWFEPMLATLTDERFSDPGWIFERKLDGERVLAWRENGAARLMTRNRKDVSASYPELVEALEAQDGRFVVDGEVVAFEGRRTSFARLQQRMQIRDADEARASGIAVYFYLFDLLYLDRWCVDALPLRTRKSLLRSALAFDDPLRYTPHRNEHGEALYREACERGWEGVIAKDASHAYVHARSRAWLKFKCTRGQELVIGGFTEPRGARKGFGALLVGYYRGDALCYAGKVGTGFDDDFLVAFRRRLERRARETSPFAGDAPRGEEITWVRPDLVGEFGFTEWTRAGRLRHPRFLGLRRDKAAKDVVREEDGA